MACRGCKAEPRRPEIDLLAPPVVWLGVAWLGEPRPLRWAWRLSGRSRPGVRYEGCGCIAKLAALVPAWRIVRGGFRFWWRFPEIPS